jgi:hypothetical protein
MLIDADGRLALVGDMGLHALDRARQARADLEMRQELTEPILQEENLERAISDEVEDED